ncbi:MAG: glycerophosphodiester phosphodiesterase, partial [Chloroflexota bacterium]
MPYFEIVAHRGVPTEAPENTIPSFERAIDLGADAVELDVRLTRDRVPVVYHYFYLDEATPLSGPIFDYTYDQLRDVEVLGTGGNSIKGCRISTLGEILETLGGRIDLEIEIKGPEPESSGIIGSILLDYKHLWPSIEITSYEPALLLDIKQLCSGLPTDLLFPRSEEWMGLDVVAYASAHRARLAGARAVHLHPSQLSPEVVSTVRSHGVDIHAWDVNDEES